MLKKFVSKLKDSDNWTYEKVKGVATWNFSELQSSVIKSGGRHLRDRGITEVAEIDIRVKQGVSLRHSRLARLAPVKALLPDEGGTGFFEVDASGVVYMTTYDSCKRIGSISTLKSMVEKANEALERTLSNNPNLGGREAMAAFSKAGNAALRKLKSKIRGLQGSIWDERTRQLRLSVEYSTYTNIDEDTNIQKVDREILREIKQTLGEQWVVTSRPDDYSRGDEGSFVCIAKMKRG